MVFLSNTTRHFQSLFTFMLSLMNSLITGCYKEINTCWNSTNKTQNAPKSKMKYNLVIAKMNFEIIFMT